jgi:hypothetical protein
MALPTQHKLIMCRLWGSFIYWHMLIAYLPFRCWKYQLIDTAHQLVDMPVFEVRQLIKLSESVGRNHFIKINCLRRCMVQKALLNRMGINTELKIGVKKNQQLFAAHCWLTYQNHIINDSQTSTSEYIVLKKLDANNPTIFKHLNQ